MWFSAFVSWVAANGELLAVLLFFLILTCVLHVVLVFWFKIGNIAWKALDYFWYLPAIGGIVLAYYAIVERDLRTQLQAVSNSMSSKVERLADYLNYESSLTCPRILDVRLINRHPMILIPPEIDALDKEEKLRSTRQKDIRIRLCSTARDSLDLLDQWRSNARWPQVDNDIFRPRGWSVDELQSMIIDHVIEGLDVSLPSLIHLLDSSQYAREWRKLEFEQLESKLLTPISRDPDSISVLPGIQQDLLQWQYVSDQIELMSSMRWPAQKWYWVIAFAAAIRITKIMGEIMNERRKPIR